MKQSKKFNGVVFEGEQCIDGEILWMWQKVIRGLPSRVVRVTATTLGDVTISEDGDHRSSYSAIYLDQDCINALNHAWSLVSEPDWQGVGPSAHPVQTSDGGGA